MKTTLYKKIKKQIRNHWEKYNQEMQSITHYEAMKALNTYLIRFDNTEVLHLDHSTPLYSTSRAKDPKDFKGWYITGLSEGQVYDVLQNIQGLYFVYSKYLQKWVLCSTEDNIYSNRGVLATNKGVYMSKAGNIMP